MGLGRLKNFCNKLLLIASLLYTIAAYEKFHGNALLSDSGGNLHLPSCRIPGIQLLDLQTGC